MGFVGKNPHLVQVLSHEVFNRDYAAALATMVKKWFWGPLCQGKTPQSFCS